MHKSFAPFFLEGFEQNHKIYDKSPFHFVITGNFSTLNNLIPIIIQIFLFVRASLCIKPKNSFQKMGY
jgi:hypothetical protein